MISFRAIQSQPDPSRVEILIAGQVVGTLATSPEHYTATLNTNPGEVGTGFAVASVEIRNHIPNDAVRAALRVMGEMIARTKVVHAKIAFEVGA